MNITWSKDLLSELHRLGIRDVVFCPGARNAPIVSVLSQTSGFEKHSFFEERAGAFYALGLARRTGQPVAICTTSGTAVAELLPAVIEAFHTGVPLILLTADRPRRLRGTGAPQAIDQTGLFTKFVGAEFDLEDGAMFSLAKWNRRSPVHVNVCFDEPLIDEPLDHFELQPASAQASFAGRSGFAVSSGADWSVLRLTKFLRSEANLVVVVGTLESTEEHDAVTSFLVALGAPVYLEATSGLRDRPELQDLALQSGDQVLAWALKRDWIQKVLRIGGVPTVRIWRHLDELASPIEVLSLTPLPFAGLSRGELVCSEIAPVLRALQLTPRHSSRALILFSKDREASAVLLQLLEDEPMSEPAMVARLSQVIPAGSLVYLGNSLPIREWDLAAERTAGFDIEANRGVNGIDGQIASFFGLARGDVENWALVGDLTAMYDLAAPWALSCRREALPVRICVMNNGGGRIFSRMFGNEVFENRHTLNFKAWAEMWDFSYSAWHGVPMEFEADEHQIIEMFPDELSTTRFWAAYDSIWLT